MKFCVVAAALLAAAAGEEWKLGAPLPASAAAKHVEGETLLIFRGTCDEAARIAKELDSQRVIVASPAKVRCESVAAEFLEGVAAVLADTRVRRVIKSDPVGEVRAWRRGKATYETRCARCHGADGNDSSYSGIKKLGGIGARLDEKRIIERVETSGNVDLHPLNEDGRRDLAIYVASL